MQRSILILISLGLLSCYCAVPSQVPEVTPNIVMKNIKKLDPADPQATLLKLGKHLIYFTTGGEVVRLDPVTGSEQLLHRFPKPILPILFSQAERVLLQFKDRSAYCLLNLATERSITFSPSVSIDQCLAIGEEIIVFHRKNAIYFFNFRTGRQLKRRRTQRSILFNAHWLAGKVLILSSRYLYTYYPRENRLETDRLDDRPTSPFLYHKDAIYYGNSSRELVKVALPAKKKKWGFKISKRIKYQPCWINRHIAVISEDNNIYFFTPSGSLYWWQKLQSPQLFPPVVLEKNIGVFVRPVTKPSIKFFNSRKKKSVSYQLNKKISWQSHPVYSHHALYFIVQEKEDQPFQLTSIGNRYDVDVKTSPEDHFPMGQSIKFDLKAVNLIQPAFTVSLMDQGGQTLLHKTIARKQNRHFVWIPDQSGAFQLTIEVQAENIKGLKIEKSIEVIDFQALIRQQIYLRHKACRFDRIQMNQ